MNPRLLYISMRKFTEWLSLREANNIGQDYKSLQRFWIQYQKNPTPIQFRDERGQTHTGTLVGLMDAEGTFIAQDENGQRHDVHPEQIIS